MALRDVILSEPDRLSTEDYLAKVQTWLHLLHSKNSEDR